MGNAGLLVQRRFGPFFAAQFLGALNDNLFKQSLILLLSFRAGSESESGFATALAGGLFILPFFLFSATAGQVADKFDKARLIRIIKFIEIFIMAAGAVAFFTGNAVLLYSVLFLMGTHSAFFGPLKYSILPQHLRETELMAGNAFVEMGTFLAILFGMIAGAMLKDSIPLLSLAIVVVAVAGWLASRAVPSAPPSDPGLKINLNPFTELLALHRIVRRKESVFNSILGISWYWFYGATVLSVLPQFTKYFLMGAESVFTMLMVVFVIAIAVGSLVCLWLARGEIELGLVPIGAVGMSLFLADLFFVTYPSPRAELMEWREFLFGDGDGQRWRVVLDIAMAGGLSSLFIVPLYALIQHRSDADCRSRVIAANNIFNAVFMVASAVMTMVLYEMKFNTTAVLLYTAILNAVVSIYVFSLVPEFVMRLVVWILASTIYRLRYEGRDRIPHHGPALLVSNHVSFIDWFIITATCRRPVRFVMYHKYFNHPWLKPLFRLAKAVPIAGAKDDPAVMERAFAAISAELRDGNLVCIFPEGEITRSGRLERFRPGVERILARDPDVPVLPMALDGLWGSYFSHQSGRAMTGLPKPRRRVVSVRVGEAMAATAKAIEMETKVQSMLVPAV